MKKTVSVLLCIIFAAACFASCGKTESKNPVDNGKLSIVTTIFPIYDWVRQILGEKAADAEVTMLLDNGVDLHSFQPGADDIVRVSTCDLFIYVGGESDKWVGDALNQASNPGLTAVNLLDALGDSLKEEELKEGMEAEEEGAGEEEPEYDEHVWLSLGNAAALCSVISEKIIEKDPSNAEIYKANTAAYIEKLNSLDAEYKTAVENASVRTLVFGDRFPFRYLADDYGIDYYAAFAGCSAESEASFETVVFLAKKLDELGLKYIMQIESADGRLAQSIIDASKSESREILTLDSMQSVTAKDVENGKTYLSIARSNLETLKTALGVQ